MSRIRIEHGPTGTAAWHFEDVSGWPQTGHLERTGESPLPGRFVASSNVHGLSANVRFRIFKLSMSDRRQIPFIMPRPTRL